MTANRSIEFFDTQFQRQVAAGEYALNPFETAVLPFITGRVLDLGCGLGNLSVEAARRGATVTALDASAAAVEHLRDMAGKEKLPIDALQADLEHYAIDRDYDTIAAIGLLMFMKRSVALALLGQIRQHVAPGGRAIINVLVEGTTYMDMFDKNNHYLFGRNELADAFAGWEILLSRHDSFPAPNGRMKEFATIVARKAG
jgi:tellurite methyltransferase